MRRRTFVELPGISVVSAVLPTPAGTTPPIDLEPLVLMLTGAVPESSAESPDLTGLSLSVTRARKDYQACRYAELVSRLPRLLGQLDTACRCLDGDDGIRACALSADAYHVAAGFLLKIGDQGLAHVATDRSMTTALASQDPLMVGASGRIAVRLARETGIKSPESLSVYGSVLLRGAVAAAQHGQRGTAREMLAEAADAAHRMGTDANLRGTAFGAVNTAMHQVNVAVTLGDAGTAIDLARRINLGAITVTERKATLLIDVARAFFQWGKYKQAHAALRAAEETAPQEVVARPLVGSLARNLATLAPAGIRRDAEQFASRIGASK